MSCFFSYLTGSRQARPDTMLFSSLCSPTSLRPPKETLRKLCKRLVFLMFNLWDEPKLLLWRSSNSALHSVPDGNSQTQTAELPATTRLLQDFTVRLHTFLFLQGFFPRRCQTLIMTIWSCQRQNHRNHSAVVCYSILSHYWTFWSLWIIWIQTKEETRPRFEYTCLSL